MPSPLKQWRRDRRETGIWVKARNRSAGMREGEIVGEIDLTLMQCGQALYRYRGGLNNRESQLDQLREIRMALEACLGMLENVLPD